MKAIQLFENKDLKLKVRTIGNEDGGILINAEDAARGFGWTRIAQSGNETIRWERINKFINELDSCPQVGMGDYIPESVFYILGMKASNKTAQEFQKWLAIKVIPSIRKTGSYLVSNPQNVLSEMRVQMETLVNDIVTQKVNEIEEKCSNYYRPAHVEKYKISHYIKKRLGIKKANDEYELIKERVLLKLNANKWEDIPIETLVNSLNLIDESIRIIKLDRPFKQLTVFDM